MTPEAYRARVKSYGLTPLKPSYAGATLHQTREGQIVNVADAETLLPEERADVLALLAFYNDLSESH